MDIRNLEGSIVALVTPFKKDGSVDFDALERLIDFHLQMALTLSSPGTTGESATMTDDEDNSVVAAVVKQVAGRVPVIAGSGSNSTQTMLTKSLTYQGLGADGLLLITPTTTNLTKRASTSTLRPWPTPWTSPAFCTTSPAAVAAVSASAT